MPDDDPNVTKTSEETPPKTEDRLAGLLTKPGAAESVLGQISAANANIETRLQGLESLLVKLAQTQAPKPEAASSADSSDLRKLFEGTRPATPVQAPSTLTPEVVAGLVQKAVADAVAPLHQRIQKEDAKKELLDKQKASFAQAANSLPALADATSPESQLFNQIYAGMPDLRKLERAPQIIAEMVRGLSVTSRTEGRQIVDRKSQAAAQVPRYGTIEVPDDIGKANELKGKLIQEGSERGLDINSLADYMRLQVGTEVAKTQG